MANSTDEVVGLLESTDGVARACGVVEGWAQSGRAADLAELARVVEERCDPKNQESRAWFEMLGDHVEDQLALTAGDAAVDALLALVERPRSRSVTVPRSPTIRVRAFASRLGYGQPVDVFLRALERFHAAPEHRELLACWMHEIVLRGTSLAGDAQAARLRAALVEGKHPLAPMALELSATEREAPSYMPLYGDKGLGRAIDTLANGMMSVRSVPPPAEGAATTAKGISDPATEQRLLAAVTPWASGKSGKVEAKVFAITPAIEPGAMGSWLLRVLALESTAAPARLECGRTGPEGVFGPLFSAAANGGAYSSGFGGAYGRIAAWTSLGALVGAPEGALPEAIDALARDSTFLTNRAPGPWFHDVAWDLGTAVLRPDGTTVAVLAATDTD